MTLCFTGHRPNKLKGYDPKENKKLLWELSHIIEDSINEDFDTFIQGCALGIDQWCGLIVLKLKEKYPHIKLISAMPCRSIGDNWKKESVAVLDDILERSDEVVYVSEEYSTAAMQIRNQWMVDRADLVVAVWDGTPGGTANCVKYAERKKKSLVRVNPKDF